MDQKIGDREFQIIYNELKQFAREQYAKKSSPRNIQFDEIRKQINQELRDEYIPKIKISQTSPPTRNPLSIEKTYRLPF